MCTCCRRQIVAAVHARFQALHKELGAVGFAKQVPLAEQRGRLRDLRTQAAAMLRKFRAVRGEASDTACMLGYAELAGSMQAMSVPALTDSATRLEHPVSSAVLKVTSLNFEAVLRAVQNIGALRVRLHSRSLFCFA